MIETRRLRLVPCEPPHFETILTDKKGLEPLDFTPKKKVVEEPEEAAPIRVQPKRAKDGKRLSDQEKLEQARAARAKAQEERRAAHRKKVEKEEARRGEKEKEKRKEYMRAAGIKSKREADAAEGGGRGSKRRKT